MRLVTTPLLLLSLTLAGSAHAAAGVETGAEFEALCLSPEERDRRACQLVIEVIRAMDGFKAICIARGRSADELRRVYIASLAAHPERAARPFVTEVFNALRDAFPCPEQ